MIINKINLLKANRIQNNLIKFIIYNKQQTERYKLTEIDFDWATYPAIYKCYNDDFLEESIRYGVNKDLIDFVKNTAQVAEREYDKMSSRIKKAKKEKEDEKKIKYYKKAILELKKEGKI